MARPRTRNQKFTSADRHLDPENIATAFGPVEEARGEEPRRNNVTPIRQEEPRAVAPPPVAAVATRPPEAPPVADRPTESPPTPSRPARPRRSSGTST